MTFARPFSQNACASAFLFTAALFCGAATAAAEAAGQAPIQFQKPSRGSAAAAKSSNLEFRSATATAAPTAEIVEEEPAPVATRVAKVPAHAAAKQATYKPQGVRQAPAQNTVRPAFAQPSQQATGQQPTALSDYRTGGNRAQHVVTIDQNEPWFGDNVERSRVQPAGYFDGCVGCGEPACGVSEPACGCAEPTCGICEPECGLVEPDCGLVEPGCGLVEPGCGFEPGCGILGEPSCGCGEPDCGAIGCGSCVGRPGPDYWCFPVCLPRFKNLNLSAGVHGFKGPLDVFEGSREGNFGFQEAINIGGRAPLVSLIFPQLSYQLGYQAVQSQLSGSDATVEDRTQDFITVGLFRRVPAGLQFGVAWDYQEDDFLVDADFNQIRYEISIKSQRGREIGFWGATHANDATVGGTTYQSVDQYAIFFRCHFRDAGTARIWGGATNDSEGLFGADFHAPFNNRWSLQSGFNYLITDGPSGEIGSREESWNVGLNVIWHYGLTAKKGRTNPHAPLFNIADNGWMFIDERP